MYKKVQLVVENSFVNSTESSKDLRLTVYDRVFNKLVNQRGPIGKVHPIYLKASELTKTLGIVTLNNGGSYSFFPELPSESDFDHMTFNRDLHSNKHHYTRVLASGNEKVLPITAEHLTNDTFHVASFVFNEHRLMKGIPKEIIYPEVDIKMLPEIQKSFITSGKVEGSTILNFNNSKGAFCLQFFLIPNDKDYKKMTFFTKPLQANKKDFIPLDGTSIQNMVIPHEYQNNYVLGIMSFFHEMNENIPLQIITGAKRQGFYTKLNIKWNGH